MLVKMEHTPPCAIESETLTPIGRLKAVLQEDLEKWQKRDISHNRYMLISEPVVFTVAYAWGNVSVFWKLSVLQKMVKRSLLRLTAVFEKLSSRGRSFCLMLSKEDSRSGWNWLSMVILKYDIDLMIWRVSWIKDRNHRTYLSHLKKRLGIYLRSQVAL